MSPRTPTAPLTDRRMWRRAFRMAHPDAPAGDADVFIWLQSVREHLDECPGASSREVVGPPEWASRRRDPGARQTHRPERIPYDEQLGHPDEFWQLTHRALSVGQSVEEPHRSVLALLIDCDATDHGRRAERQCRGALYKQLAAIGHAVGMTKAERCRWYEIARCIPLSEAHA